MPAILLALLSAACLVWLGDLRASAPAAIAVLLLWGVGVWVLPRPLLGPRAVLLAALAVRVVLLASPASLSDDLYRYLWEGHVLLHGGNPFLHAPADALWDTWPGLAGDPLRPLVNHPEISTIYPPLSLWLFSAVAWLFYDPLAIKLVMGAADALVAWTLARVLLGRRLSIGGAWLYALHPLGAVESAGSGHLEALPILFLLLAVHAWDRGKPASGWAALGGLIKLLPAVLLLRTWRRSPWLIAAAAALGLLTLLPFLGAGSALWRGMDAYASRWAFNGGVYALLSPVLGAWTRPLLAALGVGIVGWAALRRTDPAVLALWAGGAFVCLSPTVHPWYIAWAWVPALICGVHAWTLLATLIPLSYVALISYDPATSAWIEPTWPRLLVWIPFGLALAREGLRRWTRPGPHLPRRQP